MAVMLLLAVAACGDDDAADPERFCEINAALDQIGDPFGLPPDEARAAVRQARPFMTEAVKVAPDEIRPSVELSVDAFMPLFDLFEAADFDVAQLGADEIGAITEVVLSDEVNSAGDALSEWTDDNCPE